MISIYGMLLNFIILFNRYTTPDAFAQIKNIHTGRTVHINRRSYSEKRQATDFCESKGVNIFERVVQVSIVRLFRYILPSFVSIVSVDGWYIMNC